MQVGNDVQVVGARPPSLLVNRMKISKPVLIRALFFGFGVWLGSK